MFQIEDNILIAGHPDWLPDDGYRIVSELRIAAYQMHLFANSLRDQHSIKWVAMNRIQGTSPQCVRHQDVQFFDIIN